MSGLRTRSILALTGLYPAAALVIAVITSASTASSSLVGVHQSRLVDRALKGDRLRHFEAPKDVGPSIPVESSGSSDVVIRDRAGNILFAVNNAARATIIAKQSGRSAPALKAKLPAERNLPYGCEGAFSPYAEPSKSQNNRTMMSGIFSQAEVASLGRMDIVE
jgi:hypothetical protein